MRRRFWNSPTRLVGLLAVTGVVLAPSSRAADAPTPPAPITSVPTTRTPTSNEWDALNLGRAVDLWLAGDLRGAAEQLEPIDISPASSFGEADRAAFLLACAYLRLNDRESFERVADRAADATGSPYRRWISYCQLTLARTRASAGTGLANALPAGLPGVDIMGASFLLESGRPADALRLLESTDADNALGSIHLFLQALARAAAGADATRDWERLVERPARGAVEADLIGAAVLELASARLARGEDAGAALDRMPPGSRHAARAAHLRGLAAIAAGDSAAGSDILGRILEEHPAYEARRDVKLALGQSAMDHRFWHAALRYFESAEDNWGDEYESLARLESEETLAEVWRVWEAPSAWNHEIRLAPEALLAGVAEMANESLDLRRSPDLASGKSLADSLWPALDGARVRAAWDTTDALSRFTPTADEWEALRALSSSRRRVASLAAWQERMIAERERETALRLDYLNQGGARADSSEARLAEGASRLEILLARLDAALLQLKAVRDGALAQITTRTRDTIVEFQRDVLFLQALRHFHVDGPNRDRPEQFPAGVPSPAELLTREEALASQADSLLTRVAQHYPDVINRSYAEIWEPRLMGDSRLIEAALHSELARSRRIGATLDSTLAGYANDPVLAAARARRDELAATADSLRIAEDRMRRDTAHAVAASARAALTLEREAIDYHLADASYELAVYMGTDATSPEDTVVAAEYRERAIGYMDEFLARYPESAARGETRFRLADLRLAKARDDFQARMATFLGENPTADELGNRALAPFVDYAPAIALYEKILAEDANFAHVDAVLFNLGMILSDDGQTRGAAYLARLVEEYPASPDAQEAWLRMGSDRFDAEDYAGCVPLFEHCAAGKDPSFTAIALYKLGWAYFEEDRFDGSADAFRRLMDHYAAHADVARSMDLRDEAEEYLVHSLARAGGADAFRDYFDRVGHRDYEARILMSLGHLMRSLSLYEEAVACDELWLRRYPTDPQALEVADRMVATYQRWNKPDQARDAKLAQAERFLPGGAWYEANRDDELRRASLSFAQSAYRETAAYYHRRARATNDPASWQAALTNYEQYLTQWPGTADKHRIHYLAGEAASRLKQYPRSLVHLKAAAASDSTALAVEAAWQHVAVTDAWYRDSRPTGAATGNDTLAVKLLATSGEFVSRYPADKRAADIVWRQGNVAYAHGWYTEAATSLEAFANAYAADPRATQAVRMGGDARYRRAEYQLAGAAYEQALALARASGQDSVAAALEVTIPSCYFKYAESVAAADSAHGDEKAAPLFARVAKLWPRFQYHDLALYRAGLGFAAHKSYADAAASWEQLLAEHPKSEYARDSAVQIALAHEKSGNAHSAAAAYERFSRLYPQDPDAPEALLKAIDLLVTAHDDAGAEQMRSALLERFPGETDAVMEIRAERAGRELAKVSAGGPALSALLATPKAATSAKGAAPASDLQAYLDLAAKHPELASPAILAQVDYLKAEEQYPAYAAMRLTQPLPKAIEKKKASLEALLKAYETCTAHGVAEYARASAYRVGQALIEFGDALMTSERPEGLSEEDLLAYDDVISGQSFEFYDRGEDVWSTMLQQARDANGDDPGGWLVRTRDALWPRLAERFRFRPEVDYPRLAATPPPEPGTE